MDIEFHYCMTYLIAARAGFRPSDAAILAQSAQEIDDNHIPISDTQNRRRSHPLSPNRSYQSATNLSRRAHK